MDDGSDEAIARIAERHHGIFGIHHLDELGVTRQFRRHRVATGRWEVVHDSAYRIAGTPTSWRSALVAACWAGGTRAMASHRSAAALWRLPAGQDDITEITCPRWRRARHEGVVVHETTRLDAVDIEMVDGIPCTSAVRTLFDLSGRSGPRSLDLNIDAALRSELVTLEQLLAAGARLATHGRAGSARFKAVLSERVPGASIAESPPERELAHHLVRQGLPEPVLQHVVRDARGAFVARVDLAYPDLMIVIEYDSFQEHVGKARPRA